MFPMFGTKKDKVVVYWDSILTSYNDEQLRIEILKVEVKSIKKKKRS